MTQSVPATLRPPLCRAGHSMVYWRPYGSPTGKLLVFGGQAYSSSATSTATLNDLQVCACGFAHIPHPLDSDAEWISGAFVCAYRARRPPTPPPSPVHTHTHTQRTVTLNDLLQVQVSLLVHAPRWRHSSPPLHTFPPALFPLLTPPFHTQCLAGARHQLLLLVHAQCE